MNYSENHINKIQRAINNGQEFANKYNYAIDKESILYRIIQERKKSINELQADTPYRCNNLFSDDLEEVVTKGLEKVFNNL